MRLAVSCLTCAVLFLIFLVPPVQGAESIAPRTWLDVEPEEPNRIVNFNDVLQLVPAFTGQPYPFGDPANCP